MPMSNEAAETSARWATDDRTMDVRVGWGSREYDKQRRGKDRRSLRQGRWIGLDSKGRGGLESAIAKDIPFELVGKIASASAVAEAGHVESGSSTRHVVCNAVFSAR